MKVLAIVIFTVASVSSLGSGPYLPSGWRPQGPAFYLPSELQKPAENPLKDTILQESEALGSDALREYGPPKLTEASQDLTRQALPEAVTEQAFVVIEAKFTEENGESKEVSQVEAVEEVAVNAAVTDTDVENLKEEKATEEAVTEVIEENTTVANQSEDIVQSKSIDLSIEETADTQEATTESVDTTTILVSSEGVVESVKSAEAADSDVESTQVEQLNQVQEAQVTQVTTAVEGVKNVAEVLINLENEIKAQQVQTSEDAVEVKSVQVVGQEAPEGFLEYGPPGFREYGTPQADELARSAAVVQPTEEQQKIDNNETRRRRFSPKFRSSKKQH